MYSSMDTALKTAGQIHDLKVQRFTEIYFSQTVPNLNLFANPHDSPQAHADLLKRQTNGATGQETFTHT